MRKHKAEKTKGEKTKERKKKKYGSLLGAEQKIIIWFMTRISKAILNLLHGIIFKETKITKAQKGGKEIFRLQARLVNIKFRLCVYSK